MRDPHELHSQSAARPELVQRGLELLKERSDVCAALRSKLGLADESSAPIEDETLHSMQNLGYSGNE